jgi:branched-chain amino acid transport system substrate-binding protein
MQVLEQAITATGGLNDDKLAQYIHKNPFQTIVGEIRFDESGEWATPRLLVVQFQNVRGSGLDQYLTGGRQVIVYPAQHKSGDLQYPFSK